MDEGSSIKHLTEPPQIDVFVLLKELFPYIVDFQSSLAPQVCQRKESITCSKIGFLR